MRRLVIASLGCMLLAQQVDPNVELVQVRQELQQLRAEIERLEDRIREISAGQVEVEEEVLPQLITPMSFLHYPEDVEGSRRGDIKTYLLKILVDVDGSVAEVETFRSPIREAMPAFERVAVGRTRKLLFEPGRVRGVPTPMWIHIGVHFKD